MWCYRGKWIEKGKKKPCDDDDDVCIEFVFWILPWRRRLLLRFLIKKLMVIYCCYKLERFIFLLLLFLLYMMIFFLSFLKLFIFDSSEAVIMFLRSFIYFHFNIIYTQHVFDDRKKEKKDLIPHANETSKEGGNAHTFIPLDCRDGRILVAQ